MQIQLANSDNQTKHQTRMNKHRDKHTAVEKQHASYHNTDTTCYQQIYEHQKAHEYALALVNPVFWSEYVRMRTAHSGS